MEKEMNKMEEVESEIEVDIAEAYVTGYKLSKVVNAVLRSEGLKEVPAQMIYNYISKGLIKSVEVEYQKVVTKEIAEAWIQKYVGRKLNK